tara:strand:+ start:473 stop:628 length:156 start_codon:yes stop_codon:yes gene_type:complete
MTILSKLKNFLSKSKLGRYFLIGSFTFFLIKGLIWLAIFFIAGFSLINFGG